MHPVILGDAVVCLAHVYAGDDFFNLTLVQLGEVALVAPVVPRPASGDVLDALTAYPVVPADVIVGLAVAYALDDFLHFHNVKLGEERLRLGLLKRNCLLCRLKGGVQGD